MTTGRVRQLPLLLPLAVVASLALAVPEAQAAPRCFGKSATIVGTSKSETINGTSKADVIVGLGGGDLIRGRGGNDTICGAGDKDTVLGQGGNDLISGDSGADKVVGGGGADEVVGGGANDDVFGGARFDILWGGLGNDDLFGGGAQDILLGNAASDLLDGGSGPFDVASYLFAENGITASLTTNQATGEGTDTLRSIEGLEGSSKSDTFVGSSGDDFFWDYKAGDSYNGLDGFDLVSFFRSQASIDADLTTGQASGQGQDTLISIEALAGSFNGDMLTGDAIHNHLFGLGGNDSIDALGGDDYLHGGKGLSDDGDGGEGTDGCVAIEIETSCELNEHPPAARTAVRGRAPATAQTTPSAAWNGS
jgi:Ca2+-binding RTX toxin-like protein